MRTIEDIYREVESVPDFSGHKISSPTYKNGYGDTVLHIVSNWGDCQAIELLIEAGAEINATGETGFTPLHCAAEQNRPTAICALLRLGARSKPDNNGQTPLELALSLGNEEAVDAFRKNT